MPTSEQEKPANQTLNAVVRKTFAPREKGFSLDVDFTAIPGFTVLFGPSGSGKTTLLDCVAGLATPEAGRITLRERVLFDATGQINVPVAKRGLGYVFQDLALFPHLTVEQNAQYGLAQLSRTARQERTIAMLRNFHIDHLSERRPSEVSGGERQRVALARVLVTDPGVLLLDEPLAALDAPSKAKIIDDMRQWNQAHRISILYVTHMLEEVFALGEPVIVLDAGRIVSQGTPHEVMEAPQRETVAQLAGFENIFDAVVETVNPERGTMACRVAGDGGRVLLETPLVRGGVGSALRVGIRAGDILLATT